MSMTREEAIKILVRAQRGLIATAFSEYEHKMIEALEMALSALRCPTREQVGNEWRGCEKCNGAGEYSRYAENLTKILLAKYCPHCGRPLTDEAVDMVMERLEALK